MIEVDTRFTVPIYTAGEVARHLAMSTSTLRSWVRKEGLVLSVPTRTNRDPRIPFIGLAQAEMYRQLRGAGLSMQAITVGMRRAHQALGENMLKRGVLAHDAKDLLVNLGDDVDAEWTRARDMQGGLKGVIERSLTVLEWESDFPLAIQLAAYEGAKVIADPRFSSGHPIDAATGVRVDDLVNMFRAGDDIAMISKEYGVESALIETAIRVQFRTAA